MEQKGKERKSLRPNHSAFLRVLIRWQRCHYQSQRGIHTLPQDNAAEQDQTAQILLPLLPNLSQKPPHKGEETYVLQEAGSYLAEVGVVIVVLFLQVSHEAHLKSVDVFNVPKDHLQLFITEHVPSLPALL